MTEIKSIYNGPRDESFKNLILSLLKRGNLKSKYLNILTSDENMKEYSNAFTAKSADAKNNYEQFEQLGDLSINKFIVQYTYEIFPQLRCSEGVKVAARVRINYGSVIQLSKIARKLGFWDFISAAQEGVSDRKDFYFRSRHVIQLLEDTFESVIGCTEVLIDRAMGAVGIGYAIVYTILKSIFEEHVNISIRFEDLYDAKTRFKETFDLYKDIGSWKILTNKIQQPDEKFIHESKAFLIPPKLGTRPIKKIEDGIEMLYAHTRWKLIGIGQDPVKSESERIASEQAIETLKGQGIYKHPPSIYKKFCVDFENLKI